MPEAVPDAKPWITIRKDKADPQLPGAWVWDVKTNQVKPFELGIVEFGNLRGPLRYSWYYDPPPTTPVLDSFKVCGSSAKCSLELCKKLNNTLADHVVLVVVSDGPLKADAKGPYEFPDGTTFDSVEWHIKKVGNCP